MPLGFRARIAIAVAVSAVASLIIAASFLKRKKPRKQKGKNVSLSRHSSLSCKSSNGRKYQSISSYRLMLVITWLCLIHLTPQT